MFEKLILQSGDTIRKVNYRNEGFMGETDIYEFEVINAAGEVVGLVIHKEHMAVNGFKESQSLLQKDKSGSTILNLHW